MPDPAASATVAGGRVQAERMGAVRSTTNRDHWAAIWGGLLVSAICFEGLGRKYIPFVPPPAFYLAKDAVLVAGLVVFGVDARVRNAALGLLRGFELVLVVALAWTVLEVANPESPSLALGLLGLRAYWFWWLAPLVVATALRSAAARRALAPFLGAVALVIAGYAAYQFASPAGSAVNQYAGYEGWTDPATVASTGRARVSSTFAYISGFSGFAMVVAPVLVWLGLEADTRRKRVILFAGASATLLTVPMTGSRGATIMAVAAMALVLWRTGLLWKRAGRRVAALLACAAVAAAWLAPEAAAGVRDRFDPEETRGRIIEAALGVTPAPLFLNEYPILGIGTGTQHNAATILQVAREWQVEGEPDRYLIELGAPGFILMYLRRIGLAICFVRLATRLRRAKRLAASGVAAWLAVISMTGNLVFDHVLQALFFLAAGLALAAANEANEASLGIANRSTAPGLR